MKYLSIDIETTGLDETWCQVLEVGCICADTTDCATPVEELPSFKCRFYYDRVVGQPFALHMNAALILDMDKRDPIHNYIHPDGFWSRFEDWVTTTCQMGDYKPSFAGKNYGTFDSRFLWALPRWRRDRFSARVLDPAIYYHHPRTDPKLPDLKTCIERAGLRDWDESKHHRALEDAAVVIRLLRAGEDYIYRRMSEDRVRQSYERPGVKQC